MAQIVYNYNFRPNMESMAGGSAGTAGTGMRWSVVYTGSVPSVGSTLKILIQDGQTSQVIQIGAGDAAFIEPMYCFTYRNKEYLISQSRVLFSALGLPSVFNDPNALGNGYVDMDNQTDNPENLVAMATYQGKLAFLARRSIQLWQIDDDPAQWAFFQDLVNTGTFAPASVQSKGNLDVLYLSDSGVSSLKVRETTGNAYVDDLGIAIARLVREKVLADTDLGIYSCSVIEPRSNQYWLFIHDTIFVLSDYPSSKVLAWSKFLPIDSNGVEFVPSKFVVYKGKVYCRGGDNTIYSYGGADGETYDESELTWELPYSDFKTPSNMKTAESANAVFQGKWKIFVGTDPKGPLHATPIIDSNEHTYDMGTFPVPGCSTHFKFKGICSSAERATFSSLVFNYSI